MPWQRQPHLSSKLIWEHSPFRLSALPASHQRWKPQIVNWPWMTVTWVALTMHCRIRRDRQETARPHRWGRAGQLALYGLAQARYSLLIKIGKTQGNLITPHQSSLWEVELDSTNCYIKAYLGDIWLDVGWYIERSISTSRMIRINYVLQVRPDITRKYNFFVKIFPFALEEYHATIFLGYICSQNILWLRHSCHR